MTFSRSRFPEFFSDSHGIRMHLKIEDKPLDALPIRLQDEGNIDIIPKQASSIELHPVFSHLNFLLLETLSVTQHGEFVIRSKKGNYETIVELGGHVSQRYHLSKEELEKIQQTYEKVLENWVGWRLSRKNRS
ncbi:MULTISPECIES: hypothetical protein [Nostocales]|uniref:Uncharacterized protein n=3 Tax=Nostocales TaxID=1161 RepID=A0A0C1RL90_9CYAN|nr:hypothetical protein [Tolypothrix bouteillei]KAF3888359.1 hypothetical protein DA73_0400024850 [Tolypothrix bouteillei VB521301]